MPADGLRTIIAGGRDFDNPDLMTEALRLVDWRIGVVLSGCARGADRHGEAWAERSGVDWEPWPANWEKHGKKAGPLRNLQMVKHADALVAFWDGTSRGTGNVISLAKRHGLKMAVIRYDQKND